MATQRAGPQSVPDTTDLSGKTIGRYSVLRKIGVGGMGEVYLAEDRTLKRQVALKRVHPRLRSDWIHVQRLVKEAERVSSLNHPCVAAVYDILHEAGEIVLVMEYVDGTSLRTRLQGPLDVHEVVHIAIKCCEALQAAHEKAIVHGDIKPENVMLTTTGGVKLLDFGVARRLGMSHETVDSVSSLDADHVGGTPSYMAPEVLLNQDPDARSDLFSLGIVLYEALAGHHPFQAESLLQRSDKIVHETPTPLNKFNPRLLPGVESIVARLLEKSPEKRYASAAEVMEDLRRVQGGHGRSTTLRNAIGRLIKREDRATILMVLLLVTAMFSGILLRQRGKSTDSPEIAASVPAEKFVAVLPFRYIGGSTENVAFAEGITATVTARLTQFANRKQLQVAPGDELHRSGIADIASARKSLGVNLVLEGNLHRSGDAVRVTVALVDANSRRQLRTETITASMADSLALEDQISFAAARLLDTAPPQPNTVLAAGPGRGAYEYYLQGQGHLQSYKIDQVDAAIDAFKTAIEMNPGYAAAYAGLGEAFGRKQETDPRREWAEAVRVNCEKALALDPQLPAGHVCLGNYYHEVGGYERALVEFEKALRADPASTPALLGTASAYEQLNKNDQAEVTYKRAVEMRPQFWRSYSDLGAFYARRTRYTEAVAQVDQAVSLVPENGRPLHQLGGIYYLMGDFDSATKALNRALSLDPTPNTFMNLGLVQFSDRNYDGALVNFTRAAKMDPGYAQLGNLARAYYWAPGKRGEAAQQFRLALDAANNALQINPKDADAMIMSASYYAMLGDKQPAFDALRRALARQPRNPEYHFWAAVVHNQFGDRREALDRLEQAAKLGYSQMEIKTAPEFENLQGDPRYQRLSGS
jgi:tetratricopeptide (TPR) repeat protein/tRNA A-37 threonylcarbamoyl transferase component Bud32